MWNELENALAWFKAAPAEWMASGKQNLSAAAQWIWEVLQGDFNDSQSTAQIATSTVISMIPFVDQICDIRDVVANCRKINEDASNKLSWLALILTLMGLFPVLGSLAKGCLKIVFASARKGILKGAAKTVDSNLWKATQPWVEAGIVKLNQHLADPAVRKTLAVLKIDNVYKYLAQQTRKLKGQLNVQALTTAFDQALDAFKSLANLIERWGSAAMKTQVGRMLKMVQTVRHQANAHLLELLKPVRDWLDQLARRLEIEADMAHRAYTNTVNPHHHRSPRLNADQELLEFEKKMPGWVDRRVKPAYKAIDLDEDPNALLSIKEKVAEGWSDPRTKTGPLTDAYETFHTIEGVEIGPGTTLYRVIAPNSFDSSICWMRKEEFDKLTSKADWRRRFAVWKNWNSNGEFVTYTVPPGKPLKAWEGVTASQRLKKGSPYFLEGGAVQVVIDPKDLSKSHMGKRQATGWGTSDGFSQEPDFTGIPSLKNNWKE